MRVSMYAHRSTVSRTSSPARPRARARVRARVGVRVVSGTCAVHISGGDGCGAVIRMHSKSELWMHSDLELDAPIRHVDTKSEQDCPACEERRVCV